MESFWKPKSKAKPLFNANKYPKRSVKEKRLIARNPYKDSDRDGVMNWFDCKPLVRRKQDFMKQGVPPVVTNPINISPRVEPTPKVPSVPIPIPVTPPKIVQRNPIERLPITPDTKYDKKILPITPDTKYNVKNLSQNLQQNLQEKQQNIKQQLTPPRPNMADPSAVWAKLHSYQYKTITDSKGNQQGVIFKDGQWVSAWSEFRTFLKDNPGYKQPPNLGGWTDKQIYNYLHPRILKR